MEHVWARDNFALAVVSETNKQTNKQHFMLNLAAAGLVRPDPCLLATSVSNFPLLPDPGAGTGAVADF